MQVPGPKTPVDRCESAAQYTESAVTQYVDTFTPPAEISTGLLAEGASLRVARIALATTQQEYRTAVVDCIAPRIAVVLTDMRADAVVRSAKRAADDADKTVSAMVFPEGVTPIVRLLGQSEVDALIALEGRILAVAGRWSEATATHARIVEVRTRYETALANRDAAFSLAARKRAMRDGTKESFLDTFASVANRIKALFPRDKTLQDIFFEDVRKSDDGGVETEG